MKNSIYGQEMIKSFQNNSNITEQMISRPEAQDIDGSTYTYTIEPYGAWQTLYSVGGRIKNTAFQSQLQQDWRLSIWDSVQH